MRHSPSLPKSWPHMIKTKLPYVLLVVALGLWGEASIFNWSVVSRQLSDSAASESAEAAVDSLTSRSLTAANADAAVGVGNLRGASHRKDLVWIHSDSQPFNANSLASQANHLIIVAGHSVLVSGDVTNAARDDSVWFLYDYQRNRGLPQAIVHHIQAGIRLALEDERSLLMFSGGQTRAVTGPETEGGSYFRVADALGLWDGRNVFAEENEDNEASSSSSSSSSTVRARTITEEYATDSFENFSFSICRFKEITGSYPTKVSLVSFTFKQTRFETLHANALQWPLKHFHYVGVDPPAYTGFNLQESSTGEKYNSLLPFQKDPYGCHTEILQKKRRERNPFARKAPYKLTCPEMRDLFKWCGPELISKERVPWGDL